MIGGGEQVRAVEQMKGSGSRMNWTEPELSSAGADEDRKLTMTEISDNAVDDSLISPPQFKTMHTHTHTHIETGTYMLTHKKTKPVTEATALKTSRS